jgi:ATP-GRASP peptide maturase of grasp-with-spasm system
MIVIISSSEDLTTDFVIDWLNYYKQHFVRINFADIINPAAENKLHYSIEGNVLQVSENRIPLNSVKSVWLRKIGTFRKSEFYKQAGKNGIEKEVIEFVISEYKSFVMAILKNIENCYWLTDDRAIGLNKWKVLHEAKKAGLEIPETHITNNIIDLERLCSGDGMITKTLREPLYLSDTDFYYTMYTKTVDGQTMDKLPDYFVPSVVQRRIEKEFEIRTFFLEDNFHSMAIFSQNDPQTVQDFREYNVTRPNRCIPYSLPEAVVDKLRTLMKRLNLNSGSIDLIKERNGDYIFLEVNPHGQFGMVDFPCNYNLHHLVATTLMQN